MNEGAMQPIYLSEIGTCQVLVFSETSIRVYETRLSEPTGRLVLRIYSIYQSNYLHHFGSCYIFKLRFPGLIRKSKKNKLFLKLYVFDYTAYFDIISLEKILIIYN